MLSLRGLLLAAVCVSAVARETLEESMDEGRGDDNDSRTHSPDSFSNSSLLTISSRDPEAAQTSAPRVTRGEPDGFGRAAADGDERTSDSTDSLPCSPRADTLQTPPDSLTGVPSGDSSGPKLLDAADTWTEPVHLRTAVSVLELGTEATMPSEDLPLIFEDVASPSVVSVTVAPAAVTTGDTERMVSMDTVHTSSDVLLSGTLDWQTSGARASVTEPDPSLERKEPDEDEEEESEEESEEDLMESTLAPHTRPPYSLIPPPPVWVQRNQGLVRSWVELIREKAGYVSGMLAPVGIGIAGALLLVGALYSIRLIHRKRRDSFKHQRRKPPREVRSGPDNAMLLADSSEDEF
ncbi:armadillo-like helical domain-containing protein 4 isoform X2 [Rhinichthys klamathensis goyatoka]|uniref:armadillo-like helical domain-containing protein 4 isoform X2 n=1 Tax=Rhinichthys klamathensis goyatoka TaxID=3034132 RepID=UPI0024B5BA31|nr:armadillo-like helical domain-containing protein 4 isoform X2 [Rhinichthys klamathensis goyatoka]